MNSAPSSRYSTASEPITPTSEMALEIGMRLHHHIDGADHRDDREDEKENDVHFRGLKATRKPVTSRFSMATGNRNFHVKPISWS